MHMCSNASPSSSPTPKLSMQVVLSSTVGLFEAEAFSYFRELLAISSEYGSYVAKLTI